MLRHISSLGLLIILTANSFSQDIQTQIDYLKDHLGRIQTKKSEFVQSFGIQEDAGESCRLWYQTSPIGKGDEMRYEFNAADLNENRIQFDTRKDLVIITVNVKGKKDLIREIENGQVSGYTDEVELYAASVEEARQMVEELKTLAQRCGEKVEKNSSLGENASKLELLEYLKENIDEVQVNDERYQQSFAFEMDKSSLITYSMTDVSESDSYTYRLNAMDLNFSRIDFDTDDKQVVVDMEIKGRRNLIQVEENGALENYEDKMRILAPNIEEARMLTAVLKDLAQLSEKEYDEASTLRSDNDPASALQYLQDHLGEVAINQDVYRQTFSHDGEYPYLISYVLVDIGDDETQTLRFNLSDLDPASIDFDVSKKEVFVTAEVERNKKWIQESEEGKVSGYVNKIAFRVIDIESARNLQAQLKQVVKHYHANPTNYFTAKYPSPSLQQALNYCKANIGKVVVDDESFAQSYTINEDGDCLAIIEIEDVDKGETMSYSFNWADINPKKIDFNTKGDELFLTAEVNGRKELIQVKENGETDDYEKEVEIRCADIESARALAAAWKFLAEHCGK